MFLLIHACNNVHDWLLIGFAFVSKLADYRGPGFESGLMQQGIYVPKGMYLPFSVQELYLSAVGN